MRLMGIDPGVTGALAVIDTDGPHILAAEALTIVDIDRSLAIVDGASLMNLVDMMQPLAVAIERQGPIYDTTRGMVSRPSHMMKLGGIVGSIATVCRARGVPVHWITPAVWKTAVGLDGKPKDRALDRAASLFPETLHFRHGRGEGSKASAIARAEAALIAWALHLRAFGGAKREGRG